MSPNYLKNKLFIFLLIISQTVLSVETDSDKANRRINKLVGHLKNTNKSNKDIELNNCAAISDNAIENFKKKLIDQKEIKTSLSKIIEWNLSGSNNFIDYLTDQKAKSENPTRKALALKWVRNAATRIFNDNDRAFLELVVNAFDSMLPASESVGKFGMGFFSILSYSDHQETDGTILQIQTCYKEKESSEFFAYQTTLQKGTETDQKDITVTFKLIEAKELNNKTGTKITLLPKNKEKKFSQQTIDGIYRYLHYLDFYKKGKINLLIERNDKIEAEQIGEVPATCNVTTDVKLLTNEISTTDTGCGIPLETTIKSLLVPSSSTKTKKPISTKDQKKETESLVAPRLVDFKGKTSENKSKSHFLIEINGVVVVVIPNKDDDPEKQIVDQFGKTKDLLISMPQITQLTLARNEIYINPNGQSFEENYLKKIIELVLTNVINTKIASANEQALVANQLIISALYNGLNYWEKQTAAEHINGLFTHHLRTVLNKLLEENKQVLPIHPVFYSIVKNICFKQLNLNNNDVILIPLDPLIVSYSYSKLERFLKEKYLQNCNNSKESIEQKLILQGLKQELIAGKNIFFVPDDILTNQTDGSVFGGITNFITGTKKVQACITECSLRQSLFVPYSYLQESLAKSQKEQAINEFLVNKIISCYADAILNPTNVNPSNLPQRVFIQNTPKRYLSGNHSINRIAENASIDNLLNMGKFGPFGETDSKLAEEFVTQNKELIKNIEFTPGYGITQPVIDCYDNKCGKTGHYHSKMYNSNHKIYINHCSTHPQIITLETLTNILFESLNGIKGLYEKNQSDSKITNFTDDCFPKVICKVLNQTILFDENTLEAFSFDMQKVNKIFNDDFFTNEHIKQIAQLEKNENTMFGRYRKNPAKSEKIKQILQDLIQKNNLLKTKLTHLQVLNFIFVFLTKEHDLINDLTGKSKNPANHFIIEYYTNSDIWPITKKNVDHLNHLFFALISLYNYPNYYQDNMQFAEKLIINSRDLNKALVQRAIKEKLEELPVSLEYQNTLDKTMDHLNIPNTMINSLILYLKIQDLDQLSNDAKKVYHEFRESMLNLYKQYFRIIDNDLSYSYGLRNNYIKAIHPENDITCADLVNLLSALKASPGLYNKLIEFQMIDFANQTNKHTRAQDLIDKQFFVPSILSNTPLSVLAYLQSHVNVHPNIIKLILDNSRNPQELMYISYLISSLKNKVGTLLEKQNSEVENNLKLVIKNFIQEKVDQDRINQVYGLNRKLKHITERITIVKKEPITKPITDFLLEIYQSTQKTFAQKTTFIASKLVVHNTKNFTLKQLINAHCQNQGLDDLINFAVPEPQENKSLCEILGFYKPKIRDEQLKKIVDKINAQDNELNLGKIEQSVEAGSEKNPACATCTECLQNSVDVIKECFKAIEANDKDTLEWLKLFGKSKDQMLEELTKVEFALATAPAESNKKNNHLCLTISDKRGFKSLKPFITDLLLPDYSNKKPELGNVGDMGNGSFKIYQQAKMVSIFTRITNKPNTVYWLTIVPLRNALTNRVEDLQITIRNVSDQVGKNYFGTSIRVVFLEEEIEKNNLNLIYIKDFLNNTIGTTNISLPFNKKIKIILKTNKEKLLLNKETKIIHKHNYQKTQKPKYIISQRHSNYLQSFVTTGGVPFRTFNSLAKQMNLIPACMLQDMAFGYIIDLDIHTYEPVQSRTQLQMSAANKMDLKIALLDAFYIIGLRKGIENINFFEKVYTHFGSECHSFNQVGLSASQKELFQKKLDAFIKDADAKAVIDQEGFFTYYKPTWSNNSFYDYINNAYKTLVPDIQNVTTKNYEIIDEWHVKTAKDRETIATSNDEKLVEKLKASLEKEFSKITETCANNISDEFTKWKKKYNKSEFAQKTKIETAVTTEFEKLLENNVVIPWLNKKIIGIIYHFKYQKMRIPYKPKNESSNNQDNDIEHYWNPNKNEIHLLNKLMQYSFDSYAKIFFTKLGVPETDLANKFTKFKFYYDPFSNTAGSYSPIKKDISLNLAYISMADYMAMIFKVLKRDMIALKLDKTFNSLFGNAAGMDATFTHELEHARRGDSHDGYHVPGTDAYGNEVNYRACANSYCKKAQELGLLDDWAKDLLQYAKAIKLPENIEYALKNLRIMESTNKMALMFNLGHLKLRSML